MVSSDGWAAAGGRGRRAGVTLVELTIALIALLVVALGTVVAQASTSDARQTARATGTVTGDLEGALEQELVRPPDPREEGGPRTRRLASTETRRSLAHEPGRARSAAARR